MPRYAPLLIAVFIALPLAGWSSEAPDIALDHVRLEGPAFLAARDTFVATGRAQPELSEETRIADWSDDLLIAAWRVRRAKPAAAAWFDRAGDEKIGIDRDQTFRFSGESLFAGATAAGLDETESLALACEPLLRSIAHPAWQQAILAQANQQPRISAWLVASEPAIWRTSLLIPTAKRLGSGVAARLAIRLAHSDTDVVVRKDAITVLSALSEKERQAEDPPKQDTDFVPLTKPTAPQKPHRVLRYAQLAASDRPMVAAALLLIAAQDDDASVRTAAAHGLERHVENRIVLPSLMALVECESDATVKAALQRAVTALSADTKP